MELKSAYNVMGLPENATLEELEAHYLDLTEERTSNERLEQVQTAYNIIREHINKINPPPKKTALQKTSDFVSFYKLQIVLGLIGVIIVGSIAVTFIKGQQEKRYEAANPADLYIVFFGGFVDEDLAPLESKIKDLFPEWDKIKLHIEYAPGGSGSEMDIGTAQKSQIFLATEKPDIYIFDAHRFDMFNDDTLYSELDLSLDNAYALLDEQNKVIGFDATDHDLFSDMLNVEQQKLIVVPKRAKQKDNAITFVNTLSESLLE